ncbi:MAG: heme-binding domain-containing protein [Cruoricaptor ignavus]|nr:heme-binding domain-containing protein [Cruoricaptor ignavus]
MKTFLNILYWFLIVLALIQFVPVDRTNKPVQAKDNFVEMMQTPTKIEQLLKNSCYDCHSNETVYPDYAYVAPISWSIKNNINKARKHLNFSEWGTYNREQKEGMLENTIADLKQNRMPHPGYVAQHKDARLSEADKKLLINYFEKILASEENN